MVITVEETSEIDSPVSFDNAALAVPRPSESRSPSLRQVFGQSTAGTDVRAKWRSWAGPAARATAKAGSRGRAIDPYADRELRQSKSPPFVALTRIEQLGSRS